VGIEEQSDQTRVKCILIKYAEAKKNIRDVTTRLMNINTSILHFNSPTTFTIACIIISCIEADFVSIMMNNGHLLTK
jgi:hypothetical protein